MKKARPLKIHVFGGTSDAVQVCLMLQQHDIEYSLSVATDAGAQAASGLKGAVFVGRLDVPQMMTFFTQNKISLVIDVTHPYATEVSKNVIRATRETKLSLIRYERSTQIDCLDNPLLIKVADIQAACLEATKLGQKIFLTTGSKDLALYRKYLPQKKLIARVLPTEDAICQCAALGFDIGEIVAIKGPFNQQMNQAMYRFYQADVVITKESGTEGGYQDKILPCLEMGIPCIVICRPRQANLHRVSDLKTLKQQLDRLIRKIEE